MIDEAFAKWDSKRDWSSSHRTIISSFTFLNFCWYFFIVASITEHGMDGLDLDLDLEETACEVSKAAVALCEERPGNWVHSYQGKKQKGNWVHLRNPNNPYKRRKEKEIRIIPIKKTNKKRKPNKSTKYVVVFVKF